MADPDAPPAHRPPPTVFLSYASEDREAAKAIRAALPALGLEVWYDESALDGGDAWDQKIRRQIRECDFFMPLISAQTEGRHEGYFRREWRLAVERTLDMADDHVFLLPIAIDDTAESGARVPDRFLSVQWMRLPGGTVTPAFEALCDRLASGQAVVEAEAPKRSKEPATKKVRVKALPPGYSPFPKSEPGEKAHFYGRVAVWLLHSAGVWFRRLPKWVRILIYIWAVLVVLRACGSVPRGSG